MNTRISAQTSSGKTTLCELVDIMTALRKPETGCPWDIKQTHASIAPYAVEEAYEVVDAIETKDDEALKEELGDLLLQVVFHAQIAAEAQAFTIDDVIEGICNKMMKRHPHVFGQPVADLDAETQTKAWEQHKANERAAKAPHDSIPSAIDGVASALPALLRAQKLQKRAARVGFDWPTALQASEKIDEELLELKTVFAQGDARAVEEEAGDLLFSCVNVVRKMNVDAEQALRAANSKFTRRFTTMEKEASVGGFVLSELGTQALEQLWSTAKSNLSDG